MTSDNGQENEKRETLADIERDLRDRADCAERHGDCETHNDGIAMLLRSIADRIEAAWKREKSEVEADALSVGGIVEAARHKPVGNAAAMREALAALIAYWDWNGFDALRESRLKDMARAAFSEPARNCDVGSAEEQTRRFDNYCRKRDCKTCPCNVMPRCHMVWAQTPYEAQEGAGE